MTEYSGRTESYSHKFEDWKEKEPDGKPCLRKATFMDVQWSDCPVEVSAVVKQLWKEYELGNDRCILKRSIQDLEEIRDEEWESNEYIDGEWKKVIINVDPLIQYFRDNNIPEDEKVIIHYWW